MIEILVALFMGVCVNGGQVPANAEALVWNAQTGWNAHGAVVDYGFHEIDGGHIRILRRYGQETDWIVFGTDQPLPETALGEWHAQCSGYRIDADDLLD